jgi:aldehyde:ferredoxin oxidoreductase
MTGPLSGTLSPTSGRTTTWFKSLVQWPKAWFSWANFGGEWGPQLKYAGYDGIVLHGKADHPVYIWVNDETVEFRDAKAVWGKDTYYAQRMIVKELGGDKKIKVVTIGPAGENLVRQAILLTDTGDAAGWGPGGVMGSKNVKAIAVRGTKGVKVADPKALMFESKRNLDISSDNRSKPVGPTVGLMGIQGTALENAFKRNASCLGCPHVCHNFLTPSSAPYGEGWCAPLIDTGLWRGQAVNGIKPVTTTFGDVVFDGPPVHDDASWLLGKMFDLMGINQFNMGGLGHARVGSWLLACYVLGIFNEKVTEPIDMSKIGTREFAETVPVAIAERKGKFGKLFGEGAVRASAYIREHPEEFGLTKEQGEKQWEVCERAYPAHGMLVHHFYREEAILSPKFRQAPICAMIWALSTRDPFATHHRAFTVYDDVNANSRGTAKLMYFNEDAGARYLDAEGRPVLTDQIGHPEKGKFYDYQNVERKPAKANFVKGTPQAVKIALAYGIQNDSLPLCDTMFPMVAGGRLGLPPNASAVSDPAAGTDVALGSRLYTAVTGISKTYDQLNEDSWRVFLLDRAICIRDDDRTRADDTFNKYHFDRPDAQGIPIDRAEFDKGMDVFYQLMGCDVKTGNPTRATLEKYGLKDIADELEKLGKLP